MQKTTNKIEVFGLSFTLHGDYIEISSNLLKKERVLSILKDYKDSQKSRQTTLNGVKLTLDYSSNRIRIYGDGINLSCYSNTILPVDNELQLLIDFIDGIPTFKNHVKFESKYKSDLYLDFYSCNNEVYIFRTDYSPISEEISYKEYSFNYDFNYSELNIATLGVHRKEYKTISNFLKTFMEAEDKVLFLKNKERNQEILLNLGYTADYDSDLLNKLGDINFEFSSEDLYAILDMFEHESNKGYKYSFEILHILYHSYKINYWKGLSKITSLINIGLDKNLYFDLKSDIHLYLSLILNKGIEEQVVELDVKTLQERLFNKELYTRRNNFSANIVREFLN